MFQVGLDSSIYAIEIDGTDEPASLAFDSNSKTVAWVDHSVNTVKQKIIGSSSERALAIGKIWLIISRCNTSL